MIHSKKPAKEILFITVQMKLESNWEQKHHHNRQKQQQPYENTPSF